MKKQLPENEWEAFFAIYGNPPFKGVRLNPLKGSRVALKTLLPFLGDPIPWEENGFYTEREKLGASPYHFAGLFYSQEPSAMSAAPLLEVRAGEKVLEVSAVFVAIGLSPENEMFAGLVELENGYIRAGDDTRTSRAGVFAAGDTRTKTLRQIVTAAADGAMAATEAEKYVRDLCLVEK